MKVKTTVKAGTDSKDFTVENTIGIPDAVGFKAEPKSKDWIVR